jgi:hypothetical protein
MAGKKTLNLSLPPADINVRNIVDLARLRFIFRDPGRVVVLVRRPRCLRRQRCRQWPETKSI